MRESAVERHFVRAVERAGGRSWKFRSPNNRGVTDRIAALPNGATWFVELKAEGGRLSRLQAIHGGELLALGQNYAVLWSTLEIDEWLRVLLQSR